MGKKCSKCGNELKANAKFCPECGAVVEEEVKEIKAESKKEPTQKNGKKVAAIAVAAIAVVGIGGLGYVKMANHKSEEPVKKQESTEPKKEKSEKKETAKKEETKKYHYQWVVQPTIEADQLYYTSDFLGEGSSVLNKYHKQYVNNMPEGVIIEKDGLLGIIDNHGSAFTEVKYDNITYRYQNGYTRTIDCILKTPEGTYDNLNYVNVEPIDTENAIREDESDSVIPDSDIYNAGYYYDGELYYTNTSADAEYSGEEVMESVIPVQQSDKRITELEEWLQLDGKYAIANKGKLVTDFIYDECGSESDGLLAVCKDGKWGYVNKKGEVVIPIEFDASWNKYVSNIADRVDADKIAEKGEYCYAAANGFVNLRKGNDWMLYDKKGNEVIPAGIFEEILPVMQGQNLCYVKKDGKWGVIEVKKKAVASTDYEAWRQPYIDWIKDDMEYDDSEISYEILDINGDETPEIAVWDSDWPGHVKIYTYEMLSDQDYINDLDMEGEDIQYIPGADVIKFSEKDQDKYTDHIYKLIGGTWHEVCMGSYGSFNYDGVELDENDDPIYTYYWHIGEVYQEELSKEQYEQKLEAIISSDKAVDIKNEGVSGEEMIKQLENYQMK